MMICSQNMMLQSQSLGEVSFINQNKHISQ